MTHKKMLSPSLLSADFADMKNEIQKVTAAGANFLHIDVMDGHFVPNLTIGMPVVKAFKAVSQIPLDVHLMIEQPERYISDFISAGAAILTIHVESTDDVKQCLQKIRRLNVKAGLSLRPKTILQDIEKYLNDVDLVLVMTVEPGFGGQVFQAEQLEKVCWLHQYRLQHQLNFLIEVDGGVNAETAALCWQAGADVLVAGSAVFQGEKSIENYRKNLQKLG